jgi:ERCC4-related helicase
MLGNYCDDILGMHREHNSVDGIFNLLDSDVNDYKVNDDDDDNDIFAVLNQQCRGNVVLDNLDIYSQLSTGTVGKLNEHGSILGEYNDMFGIYDDGKLKTEHCKLSFKPHEALTATDDNNSGTFDIFRQTAINDVVFNKFNSIPSQISSNSFIPPQLINNNSIPSKLINNNSIPSKLINNNSIPSQISSNSSIASQSESINIPISSSSYAKLDDQGGRHAPPTTVAATCTTPLRGYQQRASLQAQAKNTIIVLPTGAGKTLAAAGISMHFISQRQKVLFLEPTRLLVEQQAKCLRFETRGIVSEFMGDTKVPSTAFDILVATPDVMLRLSSSKPEHFSIDCFSLIIFDEVHHMVGVHPYRLIASKIASSTTVKPRIVGLTASLSYKIDFESIKMSIESICLDLQIKDISIFTASIEELQADGFNTSLTISEREKFSFAGMQRDPDDDDDELLSASMSSLDLTDSYKSLGPPSKSTSLQELPLPAHDLVGGFLDHIDDGQYPIHPLSMILMKTIRELEAAVKLFDPSFRTPIDRHLKVPMSAWVKGSIYKKRIYDVHETTVCLKLEHLYEAVKIIVVSKQLSLELAMYYLNMNSIVHVQPHSNTDLTYLIESIQSLWLEHQHEFSQVGILKDALRQQYSKYGEAFRCIIFVQQRVTTHILKHVIEIDPALQHLKCSMLYSQAVEATARLSITKTQAIQSIRSFSEGLSNVLIATSVAEEGMDIPSANCVIRFDAIQTPVSFTQSKGRARKAGGTFIVLHQNSRRSVDDFKNVEIQQHSIIQEMMNNPTYISNLSSPSLSFKSSSRSDSLGTLLLKSEQHQQQQRPKRGIFDRSAASILENFASNKTAAYMTSTGVLHEYMQKIEGTVSYDCSQQTTGNSASFHCLATVSCHQETLSAVGVGASKKLAKNNASVELINEILSMK